MKMFQKGFLNLLILLFLFKLSISNNSVVKFENISLKDGLSHNQITSIYQDSRGFMWFGTKNGLNRYDGHIVKNYIHIINDTTSLSNNSINAICEDKHANGLWIGTDNGICFFDFKLENFHRYWNSENNSLYPLSKQVNCILQSQSGHIWFGSNKGFKEIVKNKDKSITIKGRYLRNLKGIIESSRVEYLFECTKGDLWISFSTGELAKLTLNKGQKKLQLFNNYKWGRIVGITENNQGDLWIFTQKNGIINYKKQKGVFSEVVSKGFERNVFTNSIFHDKKDKKIWVGTEIGLYEIDLIKNSSDSTENPIVQNIYVNNPGDNNSLIDNQARKIFVSNSGVVWVGTRGNGISKLTFHTQHFHFYSNTFPKEKKNFFDEINALYEDSDELMWIGTSKGLCSYDRKTQKYSFYEKELLKLIKKDRQNIFSICEDSNGNIWLGTYGGGLLLFDKHLNKFSLFTKEDSLGLSSNSITSLKKLQNGNLLLGTFRGGIHLLLASDLLKKKPEFLDLPLKLDEVSPLFNLSRKLVFEDLMGEIWITTTLKGIYKFNPKNKETLHYQFEENNTSSISSNHITSIHQNTKEEILFGSVKGIIHLNKNSGVAKNYSMENGLPSNSIVSMISDNNKNIWILSPRSISKFDAQTGNIRNFQFYHRAFYELYIHDPLCKAKNGEIFVGAQAGNLFSFHPDKIKQNDFKPPVVITDFKISGKTYPLGKYLKSDRSDNPSQKEKQVLLHHQQNNLTFEFAALSYYNDRVYLTETSAAILWKHPLFGGDFENVKTTPEVKITDVQIAYDKQSDVFNVTGKLSSNVDAHSVIVVNDSEADKSDYWRKSFKGNVLEDGSFSCQVKELAEASGKLVVSFCFDNGAVSGETEKFGISNGAKYAYAYEGGTYNFN